MSWNSISSMDATNRSRAIQFPFGKTEFGAPRRLAAGRIVGESRPPLVRDPHPRDFHLARARDHALGGRARELSPDKLGHVGDREPVGTQYPFGAVILARREQLERVAAVGRVFGSVTLRISRHARQGGPPARYFGLRASPSGIGLSKERSIRSMPRMRSSGRATGNFKCSDFFSLPEKAFCRQWREM